VYGYFGKIRTYLQITDQLALDLVCGQRVVSLMNDLLSVKLSKQRRVQIFPYTKQSDKSG